MTQEEVDIQLKALLKLSAKEAEEKLKDLFKQGDADFRKKVFASKQFDKLAQLVVE